MKRKGAQSPTSEYKLAVNCPPNRRGCTFAQQRERAQKKNDAVENWEITLPSISLKNSTTLRQLTWFTKFPYLCRRTSPSARAPTTCYPSTRVVYIRDPLTCVFSFPAFPLSPSSRRNRPGVEKREARGILPSMINLNARTWKSVLILNRFSTLCEKYRENRDRYSPLPVPR